jgi:hypothetical protein
MTLSWKELVLHGILKKVGEPSLARYIFRYAEKMNRDYLEEEARKFHSESIGPIINIYMASLRRPRGVWVRPPACVLADETWPFHLKYLDVKKEVRWRRCSLLIRGGSSAATACENSGCVRQSCRMQWQRGGIN